MTTSGYMSGFGNEFATEAVPGALPEGRNSPQRVPYGLYAEQLSGTAFTVPRRENRRTWLYRIRPSANHPPFRAHPERLLRSGPFDEVPVSPNRLRWSPLPRPTEPTDFVEGLVTMGGNGSAAVGTGIAVHATWPTGSMVDTVFYDADGELLLVPQHGPPAALHRAGRAAARAGRDRAWCRAACAFASSCRTARRAATSARTTARCSACRSWGRSAPTASPTRATSSRRWPPSRTWSAPTRVVQKFQGKLWATELGHSPLDVVAWHGNLAPYKYDLARFNTIGTVSFDHPDPSIFTVLTIAQRHRRERPTATSSSSRRAGWWARTPSARPGSTAT